MERTNFGRRGLVVCVLGLGGGGYSRLGTAQGASEGDAAEVVHRALDLGVNLFDSAESYGTEPVFGRALEGVSREEYVLCTKAGIGRRSPEEFARVIDESLIQLRTDYIDLYQIHGLGSDLYTQAVEIFLPILLEARDLGKIRHIGVTEAFERDTRHEMLEKAIHEPAWDTMMVGCNVLNSCASQKIFPAASRNNVGTLGMFAVRYALASPDNLRRSVSDMLAAGQLDPKGPNVDSLITCLLDECETLPEAGYRFCRHLPGIDCVLSGTGSLAHLEANVCAAGKPPLSNSALRQIHDLFGAVDTVSGKTPPGDG